jgi:uncharacterized protein HemX
LLFDIYFSNSKGGSVKSVLVLIALMFAYAVTAAPQFSQSECQRLNEERLELRKQLRQPYTAEQGKQLQARQKELQQLLERHCKQPVKTPPLP